VSPYDVFGVDKINIGNGNGCLSRVWRQSTQPHTLIHTSGQAERSTGATVLRGLGADNKDVFMLDCHWLTSGESMVLIRS